MNTTEESHTICLLSIQIDKHEKFSICPNLCEIISECSLVAKFFSFFLDGLTDCEDPECCESPVCQKSQLCHTVPQPIDILLRKQPPAMTASFFEQMKFIIEDKGLQSYVQRAGFNERYFNSKSSFQLTIYMSMLVCTGTNSMNLKIRLL